jgi:hypothetical protein
VLQGFHKGKINIFLLFPLLQVNQAIWAVTAMPRTSNANDSSNVARFQGFQGIINGTEAVVARSFLYD